MPSGRFVRSRDLQENPSILLRDLNATGEPCYITEDGKAKAVLMDINHYNALMDLIEESELVHHHIDDLHHVSVQGIISSSMSSRKRR